MATLLFGLVVRALVQTYRQFGGYAARVLLEDAVNPPRSLWWAPLSVLGLPALLWGAAALFGGAKTLTPCCSTRRSCTSPAP